MRKGGVPVQIRAARLESRFSSPHKVPNVSSIRTKSAYPRTSTEDLITFDDALNWFGKVNALFPTEVSILFDLYKMQNDQEDMNDIIAHIELRLLEK